MTFAAALTVLEMRTPLLQVAHDADQLSAADYPKNTARIALINVIQPNCLYGKY